MFLQGYSVEEILRQNPNYGVLGLGLVTRARIEHDWDAQREKYIAELMSNVRHTVEKATLESIQLAADGIAVYHKLVGDKFKRFLQSGDLSDLGDMKDMSFKQFKDMVFIIKELTSNPVTSNSAAGVRTIDSNVVEAQVTVAPELPSDRPATPEETAQLLQFLTSAKV